jgi:UDP-2-acetamido-2,6-beta-L-arabino-hexul-4-ose reductase
MKILITGADGFIGRNLTLALSEREAYEVVAFKREHSLEQLDAMLRQADAIVHLAGVNRPQDPSEFEQGNAELTRELVRRLMARGLRTPVLLSSSIQVERENSYGRSKLAAEAALEEYARASGASVALFRLPNVFGKWARPNYNSVVATFCHNLTRGLPIQIDDPMAPLRLVYVDDVVAAFVHCLDKPTTGVSRPAVEPEYCTTVGDLAQQLRAFTEVRSSLMTERVGVGLARALYATYVSYLPTEAFAYSVPRYGDARGVFVEMLKTPDSGQFSYFTAHPGVTRGGHYHHSKTEKFLVIKGRARFCFRHMVDGSSCVLETHGEEPAIVETIPGWAHDVTNIGDDELVVMLWANEVFDRQRPDTIAARVQA